MTKPGSVRMELKVSHILLLLQLLPQVACSAEPDSPAPSRTCFSPGLGQSGPLLGGMACIRDICQAAVLRRLILAPMSGPFQNHHFPMATNMDVILSLRSLPRAPWDPHISACDTACALNCSTGGDGSSDALKLLPPGGSRCCVYEKLLPFPLTGILTSVGVWGPSGGCGFTLDKLLVLGVLWCNGGAEESRINAGCHHKMECGLFGGGKQYQSKNLSCQQAESKIDCAPLRRESTGRYNSSTGLSV